MHRLAFPYVFADGSAADTSNDPVLDIRLLPTPTALSASIRELAWVRNRARTLRTAPTTGALLAFRLTGLVTTANEPIPAVSVTGLQTRARDYVYRGETISVLVRFTPQGARMLGLPARELVDRIVSADRLPSAAALQELHATLMSSQSLEHARAALERVLGSLQRDPDPLVERARAELDEHRQSSIADIAAGLGLSERQLERRFQHAVGVTPKRFASLLRFERTLPLLDGGKGLARVALAAGYADQSHLSREIARFSGSSPAQLRGQRLASLAAVEMSESFKLE